MEGCQEMNMVCINNFRNMRIEENRLKEKRREGKRRGIVGKKAWEVTEWHDIVYGNHIHQVILPILQQLLMIQFVYKT